MDFSLNHLIRYVDCESKLVTVSHGYALLDIKKKITRIIIENSKFSSRLQALNQYLSFNFRVGTEGREEVLTEQNHAIPTAQEVQEQMDLILQSHGFDSSSRLREFLTYIVEEALAGRGENIKAYNIGIEVFGLGKNFNPEINTVVRVTAGRLRNKLESYYYKSDSQDRVLITIPRGNYQPEFAYLHPNAANADSAEKAAVDAPAQESKTTPLPKPQNRPTILVLPFVNLGEEARLEPFLQGIDEEIAIALSRFDELKVFTIQAHNNTHQDVWEYAARIGARFIIAGNAQLDAEQLRLRISLLDSTSRSHVWAEKFEDDLSQTSLFKVQDEIAGKVVSRLTDSFSFINRMQLRELASSGTPGLEVYEAIILYHYWIISLTKQHYQNAKNALEKAIVVEPKSASLRAMLADVYASHYQWAPNIPETEINRSLELAEQALELESTCQYANWAKGYNCYLRRDKSNFLTFASRAVELNPSNTNLQASYGLRLVMLGEHDEGLQVLQGALALNPHIPNWHKAAPFIVRYLRGEYAEALAAANHMTTANFHWNYIFRAAAFGRLGMIAEGSLEISRLLDIEPDFKPRAYDFMLKLVYQPGTVDALLGGLKLSGF